MESPVPPISFSGHGTPITFDDDIEDLEDGGMGLEDLALKSDSEEDPGREEASFVASEKLPDENQHATVTMAKLVKGKDRESSAATEKKGRLQLLDLPIDVLREIINQLPHTNDLTSLALTHSAFHNLTIPYIYSRFDIVWPDSSTHSEPRTGVDALTYGLSTLVMAEEIFDQGAAATAPETEPYPLAVRRRGNWYAQYTKKFSLGNGPADWVQEYLITKESGKMLGTLVSLAIARMRNLETFVWDMPTGVLRDVWLALSSLAHRRDGQPCRLERVWIRWHDNTQVDVANSSPPPPGPLSNLPLAPNGTQASMASAHPLPSAATAVPPLHAIDRVEHPNFSVLPSLKALTVLDIDELPYLDEMSLLIGRSQDKLRELRVGIGRHARQRDWVSVWEGNAVQQVDYSTTRIALSNVGSKRLGGVLGILVGRTYDIREASAISEPTNLTDTGALRQDILSTKTDEVQVPPLSISHDQSVNELSAQPSDTDARSMVDVVAHSGTQPTLQDSADGMDVDRESLANRRLGLEILELERVPLAVFVLQKAFDWSKMTQLTLLDCQNHEQLWKALRRTFAPRHSPSVTSTGSSARRGSVAPSDFVLQLKKIHTNTVSPSLVSFIKDALAPNSLEVLFLQEERHYNSAVSIESIYRGALRRHRGSLRKLLIDSSERETDVHFASSTKWRRWMLTREVLSFITSGKMPNLRELAFCIDYRDWHFFLQRLPHIPHIRSLYIPKIADHIHGNNIDSRELALQIVDIVTLRSEIEVCYMGLGEKCFELLENKPSTYDIRAEAGSPDISPGTMPGAYGGNDPLAMTDDETEDEEDDEDIDNDGGAMSGDESISDDSDGHESSDDESLVNEEEKKTPRLRLREILFYDDKVAIFKARHGRL